MIVTVPECVSGTYQGNYSQSVLMQNLWKGSGSSRQSVTMPRMCVRYVPGTNHLRCVLVQDLCTRRGCAGLVDHTGNAYRHIPGSSHRRCVYMQDLWEAQTTADKSSTCVECTAGQYQNQSSATAYANCRTCDIGQATRTISHRAKNVSGMYRRQPSPLCIRARLWKGSVIDG